MFFVDATGIVVAAAEIPDVKVVVIPFAFPSDGDLNNVYSFWPDTNVIPVLATSQKCRPLLSHSWNIIFKERLADLRSLPE